MQLLTDNQLIHRAYLQSPAWKEKRLEALGFHGCICNRCKEYGNDVHHKTYERAGGLELMEDLEVLCRECHEAHHEAERFSRGGKGIRMIHRRAIHPRLTEKHAKILFDEFPGSGSDLFMIINYGPTYFADRAAELLGFNFAYGKIPRQKESVISDIYDENNDTQHHISNQFKYDNNRNRWKKLVSLQEIDKFFLVRV